MFKNKNQNAKLPMLKASMRLKIQGLNQPRLLSKFIKEGVCLKNIIRENSSTMTLDINKKDSVKAFAILQNMCYNYSVVCSSGAVNVFRVAATRVGLIIGMAFFITLLALSRGFIWKMEIEGCDKVSKQVIETLLKTNQIGVGKSLKNVDKARLKNVLNGASGVVESSVEVKGTTVIVHIYESVDFAPKTPLQKVDIVSKYDAEITKITTLSGSCLVSRGQKIFKGASLIGAYRLSPDGETKLPCLASGMAYGKVNITKSVTICAKEYILKESGKTYNNSIIKLFGLKLGKSKNPFEKYRCVQEKIYPFKSNFIPIILERETIYEMQSLLINHELEELVNQKASECALDNVIKCGGKEIKTTFNVKKISGDIYTLNVFMQAEMPLI